VKPRAMVEWICAIALAAVFAGASVSKILAPHSFALMVFRYQILPYALVNVAAIYLPWIELVTALALLAPGRWRRGAALMALAMLIVFTSALLFSLARGINVACGCFSVDPDATHNAIASVIRDFGLIALAAVTLWLPRDSSEPAAPQRPGGSAFAR
jgi:hypothetical protein